MDFGICTEPQEKARLKFERNCSIARVFQQEVLEGKILVTRSLRLCHYKTRGKEKWLEYIRIAVDYRSYSSLFTTNDEHQFVWERDILICLEE